MFIFTLLLVALFLGGLPPVAVDLDRQHPLVDVQPSACLLNINGARYRVRHYGNGFYYVVYRARAFNRAVLKPFEKNLCLEFDEVGLVG